MGANVADANVCVRCDVNAKPRPTSTLWVVDANGTSLANGQVLDDYWTYSTVRKSSNFKLVAIVSCEPSGALWQGGSGAITPPLNFRLSKNFVSKNENFVNRLILNHFGS